MTMRRTRQPSGANVAAVAIVVLAAAIPYFSTVGDYFLQDDFGVIQLMSRRSWTMFFKWFTMPWTEDIWMYTPDEIRPFVALSYVITASWGAANPTPHHVLNIALHAGNGLLVMGIARTGARLGLFVATFAAVVFVVLPVQAESVAWITGRVDSMPTFFYLAAFLAYARWRQGSEDGTTPLRNSAYFWSLAWYFVALFSKQNTITLPAALIAYDLLFVRKRLRLGWSSVAAYLPFVAMTIGFLWLRHAAVGTIVREDQLNAQGFRTFAIIVSHHTQRVVFGHLGAVSTSEWFALVVFFAAAAWALARAPWQERRDLVSGALLFGVIWWVLGIAPIAVAGYESPRHVYLAAVGWSVLLGVALQAIQSLRFPAASRYAAAVALAIVALYGVQLRAVVSEWNRAAALSKKAVNRLQREVNATPAGSLVIVGVPNSSWEWAVPFMAQPPYTRTDLTIRAYIVSPWRLHCCRSQWLDYTRETIARWREQGERGPIVALYFNPRTGAMSRLTDKEYPALQTIVPALLDTDTRDALDRAMLRMLEDLVGSRPPV